MVPEERALFSKEEHLFSGVSSLHVCLSVHCIWDAGWRPKTWSRNIFSTLYATRSWARGSRWGSRLCVHACPAPSHHLYPRPFQCCCRAHSAMRICVSLVLPSLPHLRVCALVAFTIRFWFSLSFNRWVSFFYSRNCFKTNTISLFTVPLTSF